MAQFEDLLEYYIGKDPLFDVYKEKGLIDPSNIKPYEQDPRKIAEPWKLAPAKQRTSGYTYSRDKNDPSLYVKSIDKFGMQPSGPLYGKSIMDDEWLDKWSYMTKDMGVDKFGNVLERNISNREKITADLNLPEGRFSKENALSPIFGFYRDPQDIIDYPDIYGDEVAGYPGGYLPTITERNKKLAEIIGHEARHQVMGAGRTGIYEEAPTHAFYKDLPAFPGKSKSEMLNRMLDFQAGYTDVSDIYKDVYGGEYTTGTQGGKYTDTFGSEILGMPRQLTSYQADALSDQADAFTAAILAERTPGKVSLPNAEAVAATADELAVKDFIPQSIKNLFSKKEESLDDEGITGTNKWQRFLSKITRQPYRGAAQGAYGYTPAQLNSMNALGGYYSEPAKYQRQLEKRRLNILNRAAAGKAVGNVNKLLGQYGYSGTPGSGTLQFTGTPQGDPSAGAGYSRSDDSWSASPFNKGGLATMFERR
jgi:hypothetical protein